MKATGDFQDRMNLGNMLEDNLEDFLDEFGIEFLFQSPQILLQLWGGLLKMI